MGPHYENFRDAVELLRGADALRVVERADVGEAIAALLERYERGGCDGRARARRHSTSRPGRPQRAVDAVVRLLAEGNA